MSEEQQPPSNSVGLIHNLGTDSADMADGHTDTRRFSIIPDEAVILLLYMGVRGRRSKSWEQLREDYLNLQIGVGGRGRRDCIRGESVMRGGGPGAIESEIQRPNLLARHTWARDKEAAYQQQKRELGLDEP